MRVAGARGSVEYFRPIVSKKRGAPDRPDNSGSGRVIGVPGCNTNPELHFNGLHFESRLISLISERISAAHQIDVQTLEQSYES
jgi:hypothetical protein